LNLRTGRASVRPVGDPVSNNPELEQAIKDAAAAVDARTGKASEPAAAIEVEVQASKPAEPSPVDAYSAAKKQLEEALAQAKKDSGDLKDRWMRAAADLENYKKRAAKEREEVVKFGNERLLKDLLPVLDDLDRTVQAGTAAAATAESPALQTFLEGARLTQKKFLTQLEKSGVEGFEVTGKPFDPTQHEAVQQVASDVPAGGVAFEIRRGFFLNGRLLRPALVAVSLGPAS
jgi:molecular chaperone GrpE